MFTCASSSRQYSLSAMNIWLLINTLCHFLVMSSYNKNTASVIPALLIKYRSMWVKNRTNRLLPLKCLNNHTHIHFLSNLFAEKAHMESNYHTDTQKYTTIYRIHTSINLIDLFLCKTKMHIKTTTRVLSHFPENLIINTLVTAFVHKNKVTSV